MVRFADARWLLAGLVSAVVSPAWAQDRRPERPEPRALDDEARAACVKWRKRSGTEPGPYVVSKFAAHDLVLLGEVHEVKENCEFVSALAGPLYKAGVRTLCTEFVPSRLNDRLAGIVAAADYGESAVADLFRRGPWPTWGYQECLDVVRAVWALNRTLPVGAEPFRMAGIDASRSHPQPRKSPVVALTGRPSANRGIIPPVSGRSTPEQATASGPPPLGSLAAAPNRSGSPAVQANRSGWASRVHPVSSCNPSAQSGRAAV
jgi:hypothetical protein